VTSNLVATYCKKLGTPKYYIKVKEVFLGKPITWDTTNKVHPAPFLSFFQVPRVPHFQVGAASTDFLETNHLNFLR